MGHGKDGLFQYGVSLYAILLFTVHYFTDEKKYHE